MVRNGRAVAPLAERRTAAEAMAFIAAHFPEGFLAEAKAYQRLSYTQILELHGEHDGVPTSARERNLLCLVATLPQVQPLGRSLAILDLSQAIDRIALRCDGSTPTFATGTIAWSMPDGRMLSVVQMAALMGFNVQQMSGLPESAAAFRKLVGNAIHVASLGTLLSATLAAVAQHATRQAPTSAASPSG